MKGKGLGLPVGTTAFAVPATGPVKVQLVNSQSGLCWESLFSAPFTKNVGRAVQGQDQ